MRAERRGFLVAALALSVLAVSDRVDAAPDACKQACETTVKACASAAHAARKGCSFECRIGTDDPALCKDRCRDRFAEDREACLGDRDRCVAQCKEVAPSTRCERECVAAREECLVALNDAGETEACRTDCKKAGSERDRECSGEATCRGRVQVAFAECLEGCLARVREAQATCEKAHGDCAIRCAPPEAAELATP